MSWPTRTSRGRSAVADLRALTIRQPWAWAVGVAGKDVETRGWQTSHRGLRAIHAGKGEDDPDGMPDAARRMYQQAARLPAAALGAVVAVADVVGCHQAWGGCGCSEWAGMQGSIPDDVWAFKQFPAQVPPLP